MPFITLKQPDTTMTLERDKSAARTRASRQLNVSKTVGSLITMLLIAEELMKGHNESLQTALKVPTKPLRATTQSILNFATPTGGGI